MWLGGEKIIKAVFLIKYSVIDKNLVLPTGAAVPVLGLSNKAVFQNEVDTRPEERHVKDQYDDNSYFTPQCFTGKNCITTS